MGLTPEISVRKKIFTGSTHKAVLLIILLTLVVYANSFKNSFVWDDFWVTVDCDFVKSWKNLPLLFSRSYLASSQDTFFLAARTVNSGELSYRPVVTLSYFIDYSIWKSNSFGYHLTNLFLHLCNAILLYFFVALIIKNKNIALLASLLFALHPVNTEAADVISFREDLLTFLFFLSSFILYIKSVTHAGIKKISVYAFSLLLFLLSLFSKEMGITLPVMLILYDYLFVFRGKIRDIFVNFRSRYLSFFLASLFYLWVWGVIMKNNTVQASYPADNISTNIFTMLTVIAGYIKWVLLPFNIHVTITKPYLIASGLAPGVLVSILLIVLLLAFAIRLYKRSREISFSIFWFFITLLPVYNIFPIKNIMAARYLYIPIVGFCMLAAKALFYTPELKFKAISNNLLQEIMRAIIIVVLIFYSTFTIIRNRTWRDDFTLWSEMARIYPNSALPHYNLGNSYIDKGLVEEAMNEYNTAIRLNPNFVDSYISLGYCYYSGGKIEEGIAEYKKALKINPNLPDAYFNLGVIFIDKGQYSQALSYLEKAMKIDSKYLPPYYGLGIAYVRMGNFAGARKIWKKGLEINPDYKKIIENLKKLDELGL